MSLISEKIRRVERTGELSKLSRDEMTTTEKSYQSVLGQIQREYKSGRDFIRPKIQEGLKRLKLYNNQQRDKDRVGDPLIFTIFQTILSSLYTDRLMTEFLAREEGDEDTADNLNGLAEYDYDEMGKPEHDHDWIWDAMAWGRGLSFFNHFDRESKTPIPEVWDPLAFVRDPDAVSVNGNRLGHGAMKFGYREVWLTIDEMKSNLEYFNLKSLKKDDSSALSLAREMEQARAQAQNRETQISRSDQGDSYRVTQGFSVIDGIKHWVELGNERGLIIRLQPIAGRNGGTAERWPLIDRTIYPIAHDWDGVSVFDILEDKQRFRAALLNLIGEGARSDVYPMRLFNEDKMRKSQDKNFAFDKWIPVKGNPDDAVLTLAPAGNTQKAQFILDFLDVAAQKALATPELQQGAISSKDRTLGELELVATKVEGRYSLASRIFGWSEKAFWKRWYDIYERDFEEGIDKKVVRLMGSFGPQWREITRDKIVASHSLGPDIKIESRTVSEAKKARQYLQMKDYLTLAFSYPDTDKLYGLRKAGRLLMPKDEVERLLPLTFDERQAREENKRLNEDARLPVDVVEDHVVHLRVHAAAKDTAAAKQHIRGHEYMLMQKRITPEVFPATPSDTALRGGGGLGLSAPRQSITAPAPEGVAIPA